MRLSKLLKKFSRKVRRRISDETKENCQRLLEKAQQEADAIVAGAKKANGAYDTTLEAILKEYGPKQ